MARQSNDLIVMVLIACIAGILVLLGVNDPAIRAVFGLPLVLFIPGYTVIAAAFPGQELRTTEKLLISGGLSVALAALGGLLLNRLPGGLQTSSWAALLIAITLIASVVAWFRRRQNASAEPFHLNLDLRQALELSAALIIVVIAVQLSKAPLPPIGVSGYTEAWILPDPAQAQVVHVRINSMEFTNMAYSVQITLNGKAINQWNAVSLKPGGKWEGIITLPNALTRNDEVEAKIYRLDQPNTVYRNVILWGIK